MVDHVTPDTPKRSPGRPRSEQVRRAVLDAALELLTERRLAEITVQAISERSGISKPTIYRWWPNRGAVVTDAVFDRLEIEAPIDSPPHGSATAALRRLLLKLAALMSEPRGRIGADLLAEGQFDAAVLAAYRDRILAPRYAQIHALLERGIATGEFAADLDVDAALDLMVGPLNFRLLVQHRPLTGDAVEAVVDMAIRALRPTAWQPARAGKSRRG